jgi:hypothetical protein
MRSMGPGRLIEFLEGNGPMANAFDEFDQSTAPVAGKRGNAFDEFDAPKEKPGVVEDVARSAPGALGRGLAHVPGAPADIMNAVDSAWQWLVSKGLETTGVWSKEKATKARQPIPGLEDRSTRLMGLPSSELLIGAAEKAAGGPGYKAQTLPGEIVSTGLEIAPSVGAFGFGTLGKRAAQVLVPTATTELAGQTVRRIAPEYEQEARAVGGLVGGVGTAIAQMQRGTNAVARDAVEGRTPQEVRNARALMERGASPDGGVRVTFDEALNQVTGGRAQDVSRVARVVGNSRGGGALQDIYSGRPAEIRAAGTRAIDELNPNPYPAGVAAQRGQDAASDALTDLRTRRTDTVNPLYRRAENDVVPEAQVRTVLDRLDEVISSNPNPEVTAGARELRQRIVVEPARPGTPATRTPLGQDGRPAAPGAPVVRYDHTPATPRIPERPETNVGRLDQSRQGVRDNYMDGDLPLGATSAERTGRRVTGQALGGLDEVLQRNSEALRQGRDLYGRISDRMVTPAEQGPLGRITKVDPGSGGASHTMGEALMGVGEGHRYADEVARATRRLVRQDPRAAETLVHDFVGNVFRQATKEFKTRSAAEYSGAGFRAIMANNRPELEAVFSQLPNGQRRLAGFDRFLELAEATGYKPLKGSDTAFNLPVQKALESKGVVAGTLDAASGAAIGSALAGGPGAMTGMALSTRRALGDMYTRWRAGGNEREIAELLTNPQSARLFERLAAEPAGTARTNTTLLRLVMIANSAGQARNREEK